MVYQNHNVDPTYFFDCIEEFSFNYRIYVNTSKQVDEYGRRQLIYTADTIRGSLQDRGSRVVRSKDGNTSEHLANFYCKSLYRINKDDIIEYKNEYYLVTAIQPYDEYGVREATLKVIQLSAYKDLADYIKYLNGEKLI